MILEAKVVRIMVSKFDHHNYCPTYVWRAVVCEMHARGYKREIGTRILWESRQFLDELSGFYEDDFRQAWLVCRKWWIENEQKLPPYFHLLYYHELTGLDPSTPWELVHDRLIDLGLGYLAEKFAARKRYLG